MATNGNGGTDAEKRAEKISEALGLGAIGALLLAAAFGALLLALLWRAWVAQQLWWWFALPLGAPAITTWHAFGLVLLVALPSMRYSTDVTGEKWWYPWVALFLGPAFVLLLGAIAHGCRV